MEQRRRRQRRPSRASPRSTRRSSRACSTRRRRARHPHRGRRPRRSASPIATPRSTSMQRYAGPTLATHVGPLASTPPTGSAMSRSTTHRAGGRAQQRFRQRDRAQRHRQRRHGAGRAGCRSAGRSAPAMRATDTGGRFDQRFEGKYVRGDVVFPISPTLAVTAGVGYENIEAEPARLRPRRQRRSGDRPDRPDPDPTAPRLLTYDLDGMIWDAGVIWRPSPRTELQVRAGRRYGGTTVVGSLDHRIGQHSGIHAEVYDTVETFGGLVTSDVAGLAGPVRRQSRSADRRPRRLRVRRPGRGACFDRSLSVDQRQQLPHARRQPGLLGERRLWSYGVGAAMPIAATTGPPSPAFAAFASEDEVVQHLRHRRPPAEPDLGGQFRRLRKLVRQRSAGADTVSSLGAHA